MSRSGRSGRKGGLGVVEEKENGAPQVAAVGGNNAMGPGMGKVNPLKTYSFNRTYAEFPEKMVVVPGASSRDAKTWDENLTEDAQALCVSGVLRLFLTKGANGDVVKKADVLKVLKEIDPTYSAISNSVLQIVKRELKNTFGYYVTVKADPTNKNDGEFIVFNALCSPQLQDILSDAASARDSAWIGFVFVVLHIVNSSAGKTVDFNTLMSKIRELDDRFPDTVNKAGAGKAAVAPVPVLGADFPSLVKRMVNERYLVVKSEGGSASSTAAANKDDSKLMYSFGPRFFAEIGRRQLLTSYYDTIGQKVDISMLDEAANQEEEHRALVKEAEEAEAGVQERQPAASRDAADPAREAEKRARNR